MITFNRLWETMQKKNVTQYKLITNYGVSRGQLTRRRENCNVNTHTLNMLCEILDCRIEEICEYMPSDEL